MSRRFHELEEIRLTVDEEVREHHLNLISRALRESRATRPRRFRLLAVAATLVLVLPVVALAAENALPGDLLYPVKRMVEPVAALFDRDLQADHRVSEAEMLLDRDVETQVIRDQLARARDVVGDDRPALVERLDRVAEQLESRTGQVLDEAADPVRDEGSSDDGIPDRSEGLPVETTEPAPQSTTSTVAERDDAIGTTTTVTGTTSRPPDTRRDG